MQWANDRVLLMALRARGYHNFTSLKASGELGLIRRVAAGNPLLCIDVGANTGSYARAILEASDSLVIAFEPLPKAYAAIQTLAAEFPGRLTTVNKGVGDLDSDLNLFYGDEDSQHASFSREVNAIDYVGASNLNCMKVPVVTLDSYLTDEDPTIAERGIDLLKIDTEGFEYEVLLGARKTVLTLRPKFIQVEYNLHQLFRGQSLHSFSHLLPHYRAYQLLPNSTGFRPVDTRRPESNIYHYSNFVFVREDIAFPVRG